MIMNKPLHMMIGWLEMNIYISLRCQILETSAMKSLELVLFPIANTQAQPYYFYS